MKHSLTRRFRRNTANEAAPFKKENKQEQQFFGEPVHKAFFKPAVSTPQPAVQRKCTDCAEEEKVQRQPEKKEEDKVMKKEEKKDEEKVLRAPGNKEEDKVMKKEDTKEEEKLMKKEEKQEDEKIQKKEGPSVNGGINSGAAGYINSISGKGQNMNPSTQQFFENRIGADFSDVKIHTGKDAAESAKNINAQAYAYGNNIIFKEGKYQPETSEGKHLLAHELAHVAQQKGGNYSSSDLHQIQRKISYSKPLYIKQDPIPKQIGRGGKLGETFITVNGKKLVTKNDAVKTIFEVFNNNLALIYNSKTKICTVDTSNVNIDVSAEITLPTDPVKGKWVGSYPGNIVTGSPTCSKLAMVNIEMRSSPSGGDMLSNSIWIDEMQHFADINDVSEKHIKTYHSYLDNLTFNADDAAKCQENFSAAIGTKDIVMATAFADDWLKSVNKYDNPSGSHHYSSVTDARDCKLVTITVSY